METECVSEKSEVFKQLTRLSAREELIQFCRGENLKTYTNVKVVAVRSKKAYGGSRGTTPVILNLGARSASGPGLSLSLSLCLSLSLEIAAVRIKQEAEWDSQTVRTI
jgi:hypothetical protein